MSFSTSSAVRCSRVRSSAFGARHHRCKASSKFNTLRSTSGRFVGTSAQLRYRSPFNAPFTEAVQRDCTSGLGTVASKGKAMKTMAMISRAGVYEAIALAVFAGMVVLFVHKIVPLIAG